jgi:hypothetical protein
MPAPLVSICMPNLNKRPFLEARMESLLAQTLADWELIVCDSFSDDGSWEFLQKFRGDPRIHLHQVPRHGLYAGWNECLRRVNGAYVYIATSDDTSEPRQLEILAELLATRRDADIALGAFDFIDPEGRTLPRRPHRGIDLLGDWMDRPHRRSGPTEFLFQCAFDTIWITLNTLLFRKELLDQTGLFPTHSGRLGDLAWSLRAALASDVVYHPGARAGWRQYPGQATSHGWTASDRWTLLRDLRTVNRDPASGIPEAWRRVRGWQSILESYRLDTWHESLALDRATIRRRPGAALRGAASAALRDPAYMAAVVRRGFAPGPALQTLGARWLMDRIEQLGSPWPPVPL